MIIACYRCGKSLNNTNKSLEHVIPSSIGGKLKSYNLLCKVCNSFYGSNFDSEISRQIGFQAHILNVKTDRSLPDKIIGYTKEGEKMGFMPGLKTLNKVTLDLKGKKIDTFLKSNEVPKYVDRKKKEMFKKGKGVNYIPYTRLAGDTVYFKNSLSTDIGNLGFGGRLYFKAISRIAVNFYLFSSNNIYVVKDMIKELENDFAAPRARFYYSDTNLLVDTKEDEISHTIIIKGEPKKRILYAYIDLFSCHSHLVNLNTDYDGPVVNYIYSYDCISGNEKSVNEWLYVTRPELTDYHLLDHEKRHYFSIALHKKALDNFSRIVEKLQLNEQ